jgi:uncharacterized protein (TIGR03435 family)
MKKLLVCLLATTALFTAAMHAQDITGTWQGTLKAGRDLRIVAKFDKDPATTWKGSMYSIDQGGQPFTLSKIVVKGGSISFAVTQIGGEYSGTVNTEAGTIDGKWSQGSNPLPLLLTRVMPAATWAIPEPPEKIAPMAATANPSFDIATIKPSKPDQQGKGFTIRGRSFITINTSLVDLITFAYNLHPKQIIGLPAWTATDNYDLDAIPDTPGVPNEKQLKSMVQKLLADRFKLVFHHEKKELSAYVITLAKGGSKLTPTTSEEGGLPTLMFQGLGNMVNVNATIPGFAAVMQAAVLDRPVVDQTGLTGRYDFTLKWTPDESQFAGMGVKVPPPTDKDTLPSLFTAMPEQLGLKLDPVKTPVDVLVIDHVEKPSQN